MRAVLVVHLGISSRCRDGLPCPPTRVSLISGAGMEAGYYIL